MSINNLNPRRTVWFSPREPLNKYDIWLSKNAHLDENGEPTVDSNVQRDCDYIFKIYDCGKWNPIVGFNSTAKFKINTVANVPYEYTYNGETYTSNSIEQFHLPLFRDPEDSPAELFDAGTVYLVLKKFVSSEEWGDIFEGDIINSNLEPAAHEYLGGIWADMFSSSTHADALTADNTYLAQAKYKYQSTLNDYNLYVHAKDIYKVISNYIEDNDVDIDIINSLFNIFENSASIIKGWHQLTENATPLAIQANKPRFVIGGDPWTHEGNRGKLLKSRPNDSWYFTHGGADYSVDNSCWEYVDILDELGYDLDTMYNTKVYLNCYHGILGWDEVSGGGESYTAGYGIEFDLQNTQTSINQSIELVPIIPIDENPCSITWRGEDNYLVFSNIEDTTNVYIYNYIHVAAVGSKGFTIDLIDGNSQFFNPNPIYIYLESGNGNNFIPLKNNVITGSDVFLTNGSFGKPGEKYLITIQFGAIKIELIKPITQ